MCADVSVCLTFKSRGRNCWSSWQNHEKPFERAGRISACTRGKVSSYIVNLKIKLGKNTNGRRGFKVCVGNWHHILIGSERDDSGAPVQTGSAWTTLIFLRGWAKTNINVKQRAHSSTSLDTWRRKVLMATSSALRGKPVANWTPAGLDLEPGVSGWTWSSVSLYACRTAISSGPSEKSLDIVDRLYTCRWSWNNWTSQPINVENTSLWRVDAGCSTVCTTQNSLWYSNHHNEGHKFINPNKVDYVNLLLSLLLPGLQTGKQSSRCSTYWRDWNSPPSR